MMSSEDYREIFGHCIEEVIGLCEGTINHMEKKGLGVKVRDTDLKRQYADINEL